MDNHPEPRDLLAAYADDVLDAPARAAITAHLETCRTCRADVEGQRQVKRFLAPGSPLAPPLPAGLAARVRAGSYGAPATLRPRRVWPTLAWPRSWALAGALVLVLLVGALALSTQPHGPLAASAAAAAANLELKDHAMCEQSATIPHGVTGDPQTVGVTLSRLIDAPVAVPSAVPPGYQFAGGHALPVGHGDGAHLIWMDQHQMLSLYEAPDPGGAPPAGWRAVTVDDRSYWIAPNTAERALFWRHGGMIFLLVGALPEAGLLNLAGSLSS